MLYQYWISILLQAIKEYDGQFTEHLGILWRKRLQPGIDFMSSFYK